MFDSVKALFIVYMVFYLAVFFIWILLDLFSILIFSYSLSDKLENMSDSKIRDRIDCIVIYSTLIFCIFAVITIILFCYNIYKFYISIDWVYLNEVYSHIKIKFLDFIKK